MTRFPAPSGGTKQGYAGAPDWPGAGVGASTRDMNPSPGLFVAIPVRRLYMGKNDDTHSEGIDYALLSVSLGQPAPRLTCSLQRTLLSRLTTFTHLRPEPPHGPRQTPC